MPRLVVFLVLFFSLSTISLDPFDAVPRLHKTSIPSVLNLFLLPGVVTVFLCSPFFCHPFLVLPRLFLLMFSFAPSSSRISVPFFHSRSFCHTAPFLFAFESRITILNGNKHRQRGLPLSACRLPLSACVCHRCGLPRLPLATADTCHRCHLPPLSLGSTATPSPLATAATYHHCHLLHPQLAPACRSSRSRRKCTKLP